MDNTTYYLAQVQNRRHSPNFWMSAEYIKHAELIWCDDGTSFGYKVSDDDNEWFLPPISKEGETFHSNHNIYAGFPLSFSNTENSTFLDYQFIYKPSHFLKMAGKKWSVFRKNSRKFPARCMGKTIYRPIHPGEHLDEIERLAVKWMEEKGKTLMDGEVMLKFMLEGENRCGLFYNEQLLGMNIWDENFMFTNFRYCIDIGEPFLNEYMRLLFYLSGSIKLVNDGGGLDSPGLFRFKEKLNPVNILRVFQYKEIINESETKSTT